MLTRGPAGAVDWSRNKVGPYRILKRLRNVVTAEEVGRVYTALHQPTGQQVLLVAPRKRWRPKAAWSVLLRAHLRPTPLFSLHVRTAPSATGAAAPELERGLELLSAALKGVQYDTEAADHLVPAAPIRWRRWAAHVGAFGGAALGVFLAALIGVLLRPSAPPAQRPAVPAQVSAAEEALSAPERLPVASLEGRPTWAALMRDMPSGPFKGQYRVDDKGRCKGEFETPINGGCWVMLGKKKAPCGDNAYEWNGQCYWPSMPAGREPSSLRSAPTPMPAGRAQ